MSATTSFASVEPPPLLFGQRSPSPPFSPRSPLHSQTPHSPQPLQMEEPQDVDMTTSTTLPALSHDRQDAPMEVEQVQDGQAGEAVETAVENTIGDTVEVDAMDTTPDSSPMPLPAEPVLPETVSPASPQAVEEPPQEQSSEVNATSGNTQTEPPAAGNGTVTPPPQATQPSDPAVVIEERQRAASIPGSPGAGTSAEDGDRDDESVVEEEENGHAWHEIVEDTSTPDEQELKEIADSPEHSAHDYDYWEKRTFTELENPEYKPGATGRIHWTIDHYNGTKDKPNKELVMYSEKVNVGGYDWHIKFYPRGNDSDYLSVYVECASLLSKDPKKDTSTSKKKRKSQELKADEKESQVQPAPPSSPAPETPETFQHTPLPLLDPKRIPKRKGIAAQVSVVLYNPGEPRVHYHRTCNHRFCTGSPDWGWTRFHGPYYEIQHRHRGQRQALLRNDKLAFTAFIRVVEDDTECLWEHPSRDNPWDSLAMTGLQGFANPSHGTTGGNVVSAISSWMLLKPFRQFLYDAKAPDPMKEPRVRPKPMLTAFQKILYFLRTRPQGVGTGPVALDDLIDAFEWYGMDRNMDKMDVIEVWEVLRTKLEEELQGTPLQGRLVELFGPRRNRTTNMPTYRIPVKSQGSIQNGITAAGGSVVDSASDLPQILILELERNEFDDKSRTWKKISEKVKLDDEIQLRGGSYTLYGFVSHRENLQSGLYNSVIRPNGPGSKWFTYKDSKEDNHVVCLTQKDAIDANEGTDPKKPNDPTASVAYIVTYLRNDIAKHAFDSGDEPHWNVPQWIADEVRKDRDFSRRDIEMMDPMSSKPPEPAKSSENGEKSAKEGIPVDFTILSSKAFLEHEGPGTIDLYDPKWDDSEFVFNVTLSSTDTPKDARDKIAAMIPGIKDPRQCKFWIVGSANGTVMRPHILTTGKSDISGGTMDFDVDWTVEELVTRSPERRLWLHVIDEADLPPLPPPPKEPELVKEGNGQPVAPLAPPPGPGAPNDAAPAAEVAPPPSQPVEDTQMTEAEDTPSQQNGGVTATPTTNGEAPPMPTVPAVDTEMSGVPEPVPPPALTNLQIPSPPQLDLNVNRPPSPPAPAPPRVDEVYFYLKVFDAEKQILKAHGCYFAKRTSRVDHTIYKILEIPKDKSLLIFDEEDVSSVHQLRRRKTFQEEDIHIGSILIAQQPLSDTQKAALASTGAFSDLQSYLKAISDARNFPHLATGSSTLDYFSSEYYSGDLKHRIPHGRGKKIYHNGSTYTGEFQLGNRHGSGTMIFANGDTYQGSWENGQQHGRGVFVELETGNKYEGGWKNGKKYGEGVTHWKVAQNEERVCRICWEEPAESAFYDCGHVVACLGCARRVENCPVCRRRVLGAVKLFYVS